MPYINAMENIRFWNHKLNFILWVYGDLKRLLKDSPKHSSNELKSKMYIKINILMINLKIELNTCSYCLMHLIHCIKFFVFPISFLTSFPQNLSFLEEGTMIY